MSWKDLEFTDIRRLTAVGLELVEEGQTLGQMAQRIKDAFDAEPEPPAGPLMFSNPPSPFANAEPTVREFIDKVRAEVVKRYGEDYAKKLWARLQK